jgi:cell pole-organizing protein PopZ
MAVDWRREEPQPKTNAVSSGLEAMAKPIISPIASRQVAAAFGQLSEAFAQRANKTFDEMAEQMLRPMLQEWLDNNLPVLVERLVREEIERVARGV